MNWHTSLECWANNNILDRCSDGCHLLLLLRPRCNWTPWPTTTRVNRGCPANNLANRITKAKWGVNVLLDVSKDGLFPCLHCVLSVQGCSIVCSWNQTLCNHAGKRGSWVHLDGVGGCGKSGNTILRNPKDQFKISQYFPSYVQNRVMVSIVPQYLPRTKDG